MSDLQITRARRRRNPWAAAADRYAARRELRTKTLRARFHAWFRQGEFVLILPNGVERIIPSAEFHAAVRALDDGDADETVRMVTGSAPYLAAVWEDLRGAPESWTDELSIDGGDSMSRGASELLREARTRSRVARPPTVPVESASAAGDESRQLETLRAEHDALVRELASLRAHQVDLEESLVAERTRSELAERAAAGAHRPAGGSTVGARPDIGLSVRAVAKDELDAVVGLDDLVRELAAALELSWADPGMTLVKCRIVLDELARLEWKRVFDRPDIPGDRDRFGDLMEDLRDQMSMARETWHVQRTLYTIASRPAHYLRGTSPRLAQLAVIVTAHLLASVTSKGPLQPAG